MSTATDTLDPLERTRPFEHVGLLYHDRSEYVTAVTGFAKTALAAGTPVLVAVPTGNLEPLREVLGDDSTVTFVDMSAAGRNPGRIIPGVLLAFAQRNSGRPVCIVGEPIWPGRSADEYPACVAHEIAHEILINLVFASRPAVVLCPYDARRLDPESVLDAHRSHPIMMMPTGDRTASRDYRRPESALAALNQPLPPPPPDAGRMPFGDVLALAEIRRFVSVAAAAAGLDQDRTDDLALAVNELATNSVRHSGSDGQVYVWSEPDAMICQVEDTGHLADPLAGRIPPGPDQPGGRGLLLVNDLSDLVRIYTRPGRTTIRVYVYR
ncbi:sensor histidine kinase [Solwaraspora sp. WMMD406]|uniref:sensor histidine kinase n=1 Tax=Solwaraspora sp. WMMD406 TaxID=3016095 RepID=UPI002416D22C|nr:sensor histidine kinase [Solwaraspora sp. WMMD406]MDG4763537.1 sensor histidine kinase [Solwaraspora sp. WMMD406]